MEVTLSLLNFNTNIIFIVNQIDSDQKVSRKTIVLKLPDFPECFDWVRES